VPDVILIDTHIVIWLYEGLLTRIPLAVRQRLDRDALGISPVVHLEMGYLHEIGRVRPEPQSVLDELMTRIGLVIADVSAAALCRAALSITWTRDPFDRLLAAHATIANLPIVTKDERLRRHLPLAWWAE